MSDDARGELVVRSTPAPSGSRDRPANSHRRRRHLVGPSLAVAPGRRREPRSCDVWSHPNSRPTSAASHVAARLDVHGVSARSSGSDARRVATVCPCARAAASTTRPAPHRDPALRRPSRPTDADVWPAWTSQYDGVTCDDVMQRSHACRRSATTRPTEESQQRYATADAGPIESTVSR